MTTDRDSPGHADTPDHIEPSHFDAGEITGPRYLHVDSFYPTALAIRHGPFLDFDLERRRDWLMEFGYSRFNTFALHYDFRLPDLDRHHDHHTDWVHEDRPFFDVSHDDEYHDSGHNDGTHEDMYIDNPHEDSPHTDTGHGDYGHVDSYADVHSDHEDEAHHDYHYDFIDDHFDDFNDYGDEPFEDHGDHQDEGGRFLVSQAELQDNTFVRDTTYAVGRALSQIERHLSQIENQARLWEANVAHKVGLQFEAFSVEATRLFSDFDRRLRQFEQQIQEMQGGETSTSKPRIKMPRERKRRDRTK